MFRAELSGRTNDMDTIKYATFPYDTAEVENSLKGADYMESFQPSPVDRVEISTLSLL